MIERLLDLLGRLIMALGTTKATGIPSPVSPGVLWTLIAIEQEDTTLS